MGRMDEEGGSPLIGFIGALFVFSLVFAAVIEYSLMGQGQREQVEDKANLAALAVNLANLVLLTPGRGWYGPAGCDSGSLDSSDFAPDQVQRFALGEEPCAVGASHEAHINNLSYDKVQSLFGAGVEGDPTNAKLDYEEARDSLGLTQSGVDFHVRAWPILPTIEELLRTGQKDPNLRPLFIGDYERRQGGEVPTVLVQHSAGLEDRTNVALLWVNVTNNGTEPTLFSVRFAIPLKHDVVVEEHTPLLAPGESFNVSFSANKTSDWEWKANAAPRFDYLVRDISQTLGEGSVSLASISTTAPSPARRILTAEMDQLVWVMDDDSVSVSTTYDVLKGDGASNVNYNGWSLEVRNRTTDEIVASSSTLNANGGSKSFSLTQLGDYDLVLNGGVDWVANLDSFSVVADNPQPFTPASGTGAWVPEPPVATEAGYLDLVIEQFDFGVFHSDYANASVPYVGGGDILPDDNQVLADELPLRLRNATGDGSTFLYNTLVVGSNVDHNTLTSGNVKYPIRDWVRAGGNLVVFGSADQSVQWLQPLFHVAIDTAGGGLSVPDQNHPILNVPNELDFAAFDNQDLAWEFHTPDAATHFTHVVLQGDDDVLAVSDPGEFGSGRIILSSWRPYDLVPGPESGCGDTPPGSNCQGLLFMDNLVTLSYHGLYVDYGPTLPDNRPVGSQSRIVTLWHPELKESVELFVVVHAF